MWEKCQPLYRGFTLIKKFGILISGISTLFMMAFIGVDVFLRTTTGHPLNGCYELVQGYLMVLVTVPAMPFAFGDGVMPRVDMAINKFTPRFKRTIVCVMVVLDIIIFAVFTYLTIVFTISGFEEKTVFMAGTKYYPVYWIYPLIPAAFIMLVIEDIFVLIRNFSLHTAAMTTETNTVENLPLN